MKGIMSLVLLPLLCTGCLFTSELARLTSPDGHAVVTVTTKTKTEMWIPGPEGPKTKAQWGRLMISADGKQVYDSGFENIRLREPLAFAFDLAWSPDSRHVAFRLMNGIRIIGKDGKSRSFDVVKDNSLISSFKWTSNKDLLIVRKKTNDPFAGGGYLANAENVNIATLDIDSGLTERFTQAVKTPRFVFHSIACPMTQEISPYSNRVAFSDGTAICVYDDSTGSVVATVPIMLGGIEGTWWDTNDTVIIRLELAANKRRFVSFDIVKNRVTDRTEELLPLWTRMWDKGAYRLDWFKGKRRDRDR